MVRVGRESRESNERGVGYAACVAAKNSAPVSVVLQVLPDGENADLRLLVTSGVEGRRLVADESEFLVRVWREDGGPDGSETIRASITNVSSGAVAMAQGNAALGRLAREVALELADR